MADTIVREDNISPEIINPDQIPGVTIQVLDANVSLKGDVFGSKVKVSATDTTEGYLEDKISEGSGIFFTKTETAGNESLKINAEKLYGGDGSDGELNLANGESYTLPGSSEIQTFNFTSINIATGGDLYLGVGSAPVIIKCNGDVNIQGIINGNYKNNGADVYPPFLLGSGVTFTPTGKEVALLKGGADLIINCAGNFNASGGSIQLIGSGDAPDGALRIVTKGNYTAGTYLSSSTSVVTNPTVF